MTERDSMRDERPFAFQVWPDGFRAANENRAERDRRKALADDTLVRRCVAGDVPAWEELYARFHPLLKNAIALLLTPVHRDADLVEEIAARVWYALVENDGELLDRYDPRRGACLTTFMQAIARDLVARHFRSEHRRRGREAAAVQGKPAHSPSDQDQNLGEFLSTLTVTEREFTTKYLLAEEVDPSVSPPRSRTRASIWQLTGRIRKKLRNYLGTS